MPKRRQRGGEFTGRAIGKPETDPVPETVPTPMQKGGDLPSLSPAAADMTGGYAKSQYYTISGGGRRKSRRGRGRGRSRGRSRGRGRSYRGGSVLADAAVPFGLLALQRYFKGSKTSKQGVAKMGRSFKRTFRRHRGGGKMAPLGSAPF